MASSEQPNRGRVEALGFLEGKEGYAAVGWVNRNLINHQQIILLVNGHSVSETYAGKRATDIRSEDNKDSLIKFAFRCDELYSYLGNGDVIEFKCEGIPLDISGHGYQYIIKNNRESRVDEIIDKIKQGYVFDNLGRLIRARDEESIKKAFRLYEDLEQFMKERYGYDLIVCFGTLLGAVREGKFIKHDTRGLDAIYISAFSKPGDVVNEYIQVCFDLIEAGYMLRINRESAYVNSFKSGSRFVDLNYGWFNENDELNMAFGWYEKPAKGRNKYFSFREINMAGQMIKIPGNAEDILFQLYGNNWHIPDQGFKHDVTKRIIKTEYLLSYEDVITILHDHLKHTYQALKYEKENSGLKGTIKKVTPLTLKRLFRKVIG